MAIEPRALWACCLFPLALAGAAAECSLPEAAHQGSCILQTVARVMTPHAQQVQALTQARVVNFPIEWMHVPKCGSSFVNSIVQIPGACTGIPPDYTYEDINSSSPLTQFQEVARQQCKDGIDADRVMHPGVEDIPGWEEGKGRFMIMLRRPEQRLLSFYYFFLQELNYTLSSDTLSKYGGCVVKTLVRKFPHPDGLSCAGDPVSDEEIAEAKERLRTGFAFIGIAEQWDLSICLFNKIFGIRRCHAAQFENTRPTNGRNSTEYDVSELGDWHDDDNEIYDLAKRLFEDKLLEYNVNNLSCQSCWQEAGLV
mmetsp:Transcript_55662/g.99116  ORF Transcript_55662/g.99116 Transcript_55662/m.99116 type:complete len:311 (+) Transcript_55662:60-992(+)